MSGTSAVVASVNGANNVWPVVVFGNALMPTASEHTTNPHASGTLSRPLIAARRRDGVCMQWPVADSIAIS